MGLIVQKFGGTSVGNVEKIRNAASRTAEELQNGNNVVVVVSAMGKTTDHLVDMANDISSAPSKREMDMLLTTGEQITIALFSMALMPYPIQAGRLESKQKLSTATPGLSISTRTGLPGT